jgi:hypothetical protein
VRKAVAKVYQRPEFEERHGFGEWFWRQVGSVFERIAEWMASFGSLRNTNPVLYWAIVGALVAGIVAAIVYLVWNAARRARDDEPAAARTRLARPRTAADWEAEAMRLAGEGRLREAAAALYPALLLRLDALDVVRFDASKTPGDYRIEARGDAAASRALGAFLGIFEPVAFGGRALDADGWERMRAAVAEGTARE